MNSYKMMTIYSMKMFRVILLNFRFIKDSSFCYGIRRSATAGLTVNFEHPESSQPDREKNISRSQSSHMLQINCVFRRSVNIAFSHSRESLVCHILTDIL